MIHGASVSGYAVATMLSAAGIDTTVSGFPEQHGPLIVLNSATLGLLKDLGCDLNGELSARCHQLRFHFVAWGDSIATLDRPGIAMPHPQLLEMLRARLSVAKDTDLSWTVLASGRKG